MQQMQYDKQENSSAASMPTIGGGNVRPGLLRQAQEMAACTASGSIQERARRQAQEHARDAVRFGQLAERMTPEVENMIWCWTESLALGLVDVRVIAEAATREERKQRRDSI